MENIGDAWHRQTSKRIGEAVAKYRKDAGMTAQQLAEKCRELDVPIHRTTITKIEGGRSRFDLGELLVLAVALDVPPLVLLFPGLPDGKVEVTPGDVKSSWDAYLWATSENQHTAGAKLVEMSRKRDHLMKKYAHEGVLRALAGDAVTQKAKQREMSSLRTEIDQTDAAIRELGGTLDYA